jgi:serine protease Do
MKAKYLLMTIIISAALVLSACSPTALTGAVSAVNPASGAPAVNAAPVTTSTNPVAGSVADMEQTLEQIYAQVNPSVVAIQVTESASAGSSFFGNLPQGHPPIQPQPQAQALGSGFVWDKAGDIVTNNHVVDGATSISVEFPDGTIVPATIVGQDPDSDLAVIKVNLPADQLQPVTMGDSTQVKVGQLSVAIGNPFGNENTMTVGFISALARSLPVDNGNAAGISYSIPDVIQTDTAINPGNSGGVLTDAEGHVIGVTSAIDSPVRASSGVGFVIPSAIVSKVVPGLISSGHYDHSYIGISGTSLIPDLATAMGLNSTQRGVLVGDVSAGSPAAQAGLQGSTKQVTISGQPAQVGGDVITAIDDQPVKTFEDLVAYLARSTTVGQSVTLTILRNGQSQTVKVTLAARPKTAAQALPQINNNGNNNPTVPSIPSVPTSNRPWLGISGLTLSTDLATAMNLSASQQGVLIEQVQPNSPASQAGLQSSSKSVTIGGQSVFVGGDVITAIDQQPITAMQDLQMTILQDSVNQKVTLSILRGGKSLDVSVTLAARPATVP